MLNFCDQGNIIIFSGRIIFLVEATNEIYGICHLSVVPVRTEANDKAEIGTQLLFGDLITVNKISEDGKWAYIQIAQDEYLGWIDSKQFKEISKEHYYTCLQQPMPVSKGLFGLIKGSRKFFPVLMGSTLPMFHAGVIKIAEDTYEFEGEHMYPQMGTPRQIENTARQFLGAPYLWGGKSHFGIDCSGLVQQVYKINNIKLPRDSYKQAEVGETVAFDQHVAGDLAFFQNVNGRIIHVGIIIPGNQILHASGEVRIDILDEVGIFHAEKKVYTHKLALIKRVL